jgi:hypothetical protein
MIVYKIVRRSCEGKLMSALDGYLWGYELEYMPCEWTTPKVGQIFAFETRERAEVQLGYWKHIKRHELWEAEAPSSELPGDYVVMVTTDRQTRHFIERYWNGCREQPAISTPPIGTVIVPQLKLLRRLR